MNEFRVLVVADTHVDDRMALGGATPTLPNGEPLVLAQARTMMAWVGAVARDYGVSTIVHTGDLYERPQPTPASETVAAEALDAWCEIADVVLLLGNHDRPQGVAKHALEPLRGRRPGRLHVIDRPATRSLPHFLVAAVPTPTRTYAMRVADGREISNALLSEHLDQIVADFAQIARNNPNVPSLLVGHGTLGGATFHAYQTAPISDVRISTAHFDAFTTTAWGHLHRRQGAPGWPGSHGYVGSPDRHDFGEEGEAKGVTVFTFKRSAEGEAWTATWEFVENLHARVFRTIPVETFAQAPFDTLAATLIGTISRVTGEMEDGADLDAVVQTIQALKRRGLIVRNEVTTVCHDRSRLGPQGAREAFTLMNAVAAACEARDDLRPHKDLILSTVAELRGGAL